MTLRERPWLNVVEFASGRSLESPPRSEDFENQRDWVNAALEWSLYELNGRLHPNREFLLVGNVLIIVAAWVCFYVALRITVIQMMHPNGLQVRPSTSDDRIYCDLLGHPFYCGHVSDP